MTLALLDLQRYQLMSGVKRDIRHLKHVLLYLITGRNEVVAKVMFLLVSVILSTGGSLAGRTPPSKEAPQAGRPPLARRPPGKETPQQGDPPSRETPLARRPPSRENPTGKEAPLARRPPGRETPLARRPPVARRPSRQGEPPPQQGGPPPLPPCRENPSGKDPSPGIRSMSGRYASYWNAFLCQKLCFVYSRRAAGHRVGEHLERIIPLIVNFCRVEDDELREYCLQAFESFVRRCPKQITPHINTVNHQYQTVHSHCQNERAKKSESRRIPSSIVTGEA